MKLPSSEFIRNFILIFLSFYLIVFGGIALLMIFKVSHEEFQSMRGILTILAFLLAIGIVLIESRLIESRFKIRSDILTLRVYQNFSPF